MKKHIIIATAVVALMAPEPASAARIAYATGSRLYRDCTAEKGGSNRADCIAYLAGSVDALFMAYECEKHDLTISDIADLLTVYLRDNPKERQFTAASLIAYVLADAGLCKPR